MWFNCPKPVIKSKIASDRGALEEVPAELSDLRRRMGFDFGKFDYTEVNGEVVVYDMNKTPTFGPDFRSLIPDSIFAAFGDVINDPARSWLK